MKRKFILLPITLTTLAPAISLISVSTSCSKITEAAYWTKEQKETIKSLTNYDDRLWTIDYKAEMKMDNVIWNNQEDYYYMTKSIHDAILPNSPYLLESPYTPMPTTSIGGCTSFSLKNDKNQNIAGKNYDWFLDDSFGLLVKNQAPDAKYKSMGIANSLHLKLAGGFKQSIENKERFLYSPWMVIEGMNEKGLVVTSLLLHSGANHMNQCEPGKKILCSYFVPQLLLSECKNITECVKLLDSYNLRAYGGTDEKDNSHQWLVTDTEHSMLITYINNEMVTYSNFDETERSQFPGGINYHKPSRVCNVNFQELPTSEEDKDPLTHPDLWRYGTTLLPDNNEERINENINYLMGTNFYVNILENELQDNPQPRFEHEWSDNGEIKKSTFFNCQDNGFWRYCKCHEVLDNLEKQSKKPTTEEAMNILKQCAYCLQDGDIRALRWKRKLPFKNREDWIGLTLFSLVFNTVELTIDLCLFEKYDHVIRFSFN